MKRWIPRAVWVPVGWYLGVALVVPLLNGAGAQDGFWWHSAVVLAGVAALALGASAGHACLRKRAMERALGGVVARS